jgi:hypothetical protein
MLSVVSPPSWVYIKVKRWNAVIITPAPVVIMRAIPAAFPETPPETVPEKQVYIYIGSNVDIGRIRQHDHIRRRLQYDGRRQTYVDAYAYLRHTGNRKYHD